MKKATSLPFVAVGFLSLACGSAPAKPFDTLKNSNLIAFRLQNYDPPPQAAAAPTPQQGMIPGLPPEITQLAQQALPGLQALLPPGLLPPGMLQGMQQPQQPQQPQQQEMRFPMNQPNFRILGQTNVVDPDLKEQLAKVLGDGDKFQADHANCMYAEMGLSFTTTASPTPNDMLISFSCNQVEARSFAWPHANRGLKPDTVKELAGLVQKIWPQG
ncbi:MAG TPA: hypothetical protein VHE30_17150 [Polyangiaceae bacterium]|nr:hypothetical protein [Polyangiaceae bacterium]